MNNEIIEYNGITIVHVRGKIPPEFWCETYHSHEHAEIFIHILGKMELFIENNVYSHNGNEIRVYAPNELHFGKSKSEQQMEWYQISLSNSFLKSHHELADKIINRKKGIGNVFVSKKHETIVSLLFEIFNKQNTPLKNYYFWANIIKILCLINEPQNNIEVESGKNERLQNILETVNKNILLIKTVNDISLLTHFSSSYIHSLFKKHLNLTPHKYILTKKLSIAKEMLDNGASISEACFNSGFEDYANFITLFRKNYGVTPKKHRDIK